MASSLDGFDTSSPADAFDASVPLDPEDILSGSIPLDLSHAGGDLLALLHDELDEEGPGHQYSVTSTYVCKSLTQV